MEARKFVPNKKNIAKIILIIFLIGFSTYGLYFWYRLDKPKIIKPFQDPFVLNNGTIISTKPSWDLRREEIKELILSEEYGHLPGHPDTLNANIIKTNDLGEGHKLHTIILTIIPNNSTPSIMINFTLWLYLPNGTGPFPVVVKVSADGTGTQDQMSNYILQRGYAYACYNHLELDPDTQGYDVVGPCQSAYPTYDWGSIGVWAWGAMRVADYLLNESWVDTPDGFPNIDPNATIITGHSRRGKTALLAGALDERFKLVVPNGSGCGGAGSFLVQGYLSETISDITAPSKFKAWFHDDFDKYSNNEINLGFDQHFVRILVAPRLIISTDATEDYWANPIGTQAIYQASNPVFKFLGVEMNNAIHYRSGLHGFKKDDFSTFLNFADKMLLNKSSSGNFYMDPYNLNFPIDYHNFT